MVIRKYFISVATSSGGQANLSPDQIKSTELIAPPKPVQDLIVRIAGSIEDKVQVNQRINEKLEQIAQALFKSWFVDFEPVKAKMAALEAGGTAEDANRAAMQSISGKSEAELDTLKTRTPTSTTTLPTPPRCFRRRWRRVSLERFQRDGQSGL